MLEIATEKTHIEDLLPPDQSGPAWLTGYADIVTLLLCFFIIFFNVDAVNQSPFSAIIGSLQARLGEPTTDQINSGPIDNLSSNGETKGTAVLEKLALLEGVVVTKEDRGLLLDFADGDKFVATPFKITKQGRDRIAAVSTAILLYANQITVEIQGHSDPVPVSPIKGRPFQTNIELSALRAFSAYRQFMNQGFPAKSLTISAFSDNKALDRADKGEFLPPKATAGDRRVTFKVEMR